MAKPTLNNSSTPSTGFTFNGSQTISHTISGSDNYLIVGVSCSGGGVSVTYGGVSLTEIASVARGGGFSKLFGLLNPSVGTANVVATFSGGVTARVVLVHSWNNVHQTTPIGTPATGTATDGTTGTSITVTSDTNALIIDQLDVESGSVGLDMTQGASQTSLGEAQAASSTEGGAGSYKDGAASSTGMSWTWNSTSDGGHVGIALNGTIAMNQFVNKSISVVALGLSIFGSLPVASSAFTGDGAAMICGKYAFELDQAVVVPSPYDSVSFNVQVNTTSSKDCYVSRTKSSNSYVLRTKSFEVEF